jgi:hypothetical protein
VTPTITRGWAAAMAKTTAPRTDARRTSLTPKLMFVLENMSREKASAGRMLEFGLVFRELNHWCARRGKGEHRHRSVTDFYVEGSPKGDESKCMTAFQ